MTEMSVYENVTSESFSDIIKKKCEPAVLKGLVSRWPTVTMSPGSLLDYLESISTECPIAHFSCDAEHLGRFFYAENCTSFNFRQDQSSAPEFFARLRREAANPAPTALFAGSLALSGHFPGFAQTNTLGALIPASQCLQSIWIGNRTLTAPHYDNVENIACVVTGRRKFTLFPIAQFPNLYVGPLDLTPAGQPISLVDIRAPDYARFPRYREAEAHVLTATLEPGDAIYIPTLWWHGVESLDPINAMVNFWWRDVPSYFGSPMNALLHAVLSLRDLPESQRQSWKTVFDNLIFETNGPALDHLPVAARGAFGDLTRSSAAHIRDLLKQTQA